MSISRIGIKMLEWGIREQFHIYHSNTPKVRLLGKIALAEHECIMKDICHCHY